MLIGYARVSTDDQDLRIQRASLEAADCRRLYEEKVSGAKRDRPALGRMLDALREGDVVIVTRLDRLARSTRNLLEIAEALNEAGTGLRSLAEPWADITTPAGRMVLTVFAGIAEFERSLIQERTSSGRQAAKARGVRFGRPKKLSDDQVALGRRLVGEGRSVRDAAKLLQCHPATLYRALDETLVDDIHDRMSGVTSAKGNAGKYWCSNCRWEVRAERHNVRDANLRAILQLAQNDGWKIVYEQAEELLTELLAWMKAAGEARWEPDRAKKIILRRELVAWWNRRRQELIEGASNPAGGKLSAKLNDIGAEDSQIAMAVDLRRRYRAAVRTSRYMEDGQVERLQLLVQSKMATLRSAYVAGEIDPSGQAFHALCLKEIDQVAQNESIDGTDAAGFLKGCMYDITDRCLHRFSRPPR